MSVSSIEFFTIEELLLGFLSRLLPTLFGAEILKMFRSSNRYSSPILNKHPNIRRGGSLIDAPYKTLRGIASHFGQEGINIL